MGVTHSLHLFDPSKFVSVQHDLRNHPFASVDEVAEYLKQQHTTQDHSLLNAFDELFSSEEEDLKNWAYNLLFTLVLTQREWYLDKSLNSHALSLPLNTFSALRPIRFFVTYAGWETYLPSEIRSDEGLYGAWTAEYLKAACGTLDQFSSRDSATHYVEQLSATTLARILGRREQYDEALSAWLKYWDFWMEIREAIHETVNRGWLLGYCMYP